MSINKTEEASVLQDVNMLLMSRAKFRNKINPVCSPFKRRSKKYTSLRFLYTELAAQ